MTVTSAQCVPFVQDGQPVPKTYSCEQGAEIAFTPYFTMETKAAFQSLQWLLDGTPMKTSLDQSDLSFTYTMNAAGKQRMQAILRCTIENSPISNSFSVYPIVNFTLKILPKSGVKVIGSTGTGDGILCEPADAVTESVQIRMTAQIGQNTPQQWLDWTRPRAVSAADVNATVTVIVDNFKPCVQQVELRSGGRRTQSI